ncbi:methyltransferase domain-containing protein [Croceivirga thetidis]|uniref:Methyltransferase domain-containing protein n=1 Tax=Croceivirga thetidis TaxID=2721623 RepID=A0ABX1GQZ4_9FLAO|nr:methyltransferase domain-containing protein [Croceivirga thetidis]NKI32368.1 methyltransferase domain-containing protein [Croceivirga thetidis]
MKKLDHRNTQNELMDDPDLEIQTLKAVFVDINRVNSLLAAHHMVKNKVWQTVQGDTEKDYTLYDFGCGDGNLLRELADYLRKKKVRFKMVGLDISPKAIAIAKEASKAYPEISYSKVNILKEENSMERCDILLCGLTLHHFKTEDIPLLLERFQSITNIEIIINDLKRSYWACLWFKIISTLFIKTKIAKNDGLVSIKSGFIKPEIEGFANQLKTAVHDFKWYPNYRFIWSIKQPQFN